MVWSKGKPDRVRTVRSGVLVLVLVAVAACLMGSAPGETLSLEGRNARLLVDRDPFALRVMDADGAVLLESVGPVSFTTVTGQHVSRFVLWWLWNRGFHKPWTGADRVVSAVEKNGALEIGLGGKDGKAVVMMRAGFTDAGALRIEMEAVKKALVNRFRLSFKRDKKDGYYGMGERFNSAEHNGEIVHDWSEEGGLGLFTLSRYWSDASFNPFPRGPDMTYYPVPFFLDPDRGYGFLLDDVHYSAFDFGKSRHDRLTITNWNRRLDFLVFAAKRPLDVIEAMTAYTGRIDPPAPWVFAPMNAVVTGEDRVYEVAKLVRREHIPTTAIWSESWWWRTEWEVNRELFPHYEKMIADLHQDGFRELGYFQPYISVTAPAYKVGDENGYFTKDRKGRTYAFKLGLVDKAQVDLTNPAACKWWTESFFKKAERMGVDGWMHDFGEHTPPDSVSYDGRTGWDLHNEYPVLWAKLARDFWDKARPDNDYCFYIRGGYTGSQRYASVMWTGDQNSNFDLADGLPSNIPGILSVGISGHPIVTTDIAGYNCFVSKSTDRELFMRWTELGALLPVMRLHRGNDEICNHWNFDQDRETLEHYKKYAVLHTSLFPYIYTLVFQAAEHGWPVARHLMLEFPDDPEARKQDYQYLLGDRLLVAPVLKRGARQWKVYFPEGQWAHWWTGKVYEGPGYAVVPADLGEAPLFVRTGKVLPLFGSTIDTLVKEDRADIMGWDDADSSIKVIFYGIGRDRLELWDKTEIECERTGDSDPGSCTVSNGPHPRRWDFDFR